MACLGIIMDFCYLFFSRKYLPDYNLIISSYDVVRNDLDFFVDRHWNYLVLDEGHVIKNGKTKTTIAIKQLKSLHRLILSGTPIQNSVLELWSLFDFLMPGFLGTEKQFTQKFSRPIIASRDSKSSNKDQEAGALAMEALHRQVRGEPLLLCGCDTACKIIVWHANCLRLIFFYMLS